MRTTLITGASSGIGKEFAHKFASDGHNLLIVARNKDSLESIKTELEQIYSIQVFILIKNLSVSTAALEIYDFCKHNSLEIDILINNAGFGDHIDYVEQSQQRIISMIHVNVTNLALLTRYFLPSMIARDEGKILNVASVVGYLPTPTMAIYSATKAFVVNFTKAIYGELIGTNVSITALCPGPVNTGFAKVASMNNETFKGAITPKQVVDKAYKAMIKSKLIQFDRSLFAFVCNFMMHLIPNHILMKMMKRSMK
jgi:short-subunit dehydrogenase